jgi:hypothetical protein
MKCWVLKHLEPSGDTASFENTSTGHLRQAGLDAFVHELMQHL